VRRLASVCWIGNYPMLPLAFIHIPACETSILRSSSKDEASLYFASLEQSAFGAFGARWGHLKHRANDDRCSPHITATGFPHCRSFPPTPDCVQSK
jgi:hypothetical protein